MRYGRRGLFLSGMFKSYPAHDLSATGRQCGAIILLQSGLLHRKQSPTQEMACLPLAAFGTRRLLRQRQEFAYVLRPFGNVIIFALVSLKEIVVTKNAPLSIKDGRGCTFW